MRWGIGVFLALVAAAAALGVDLCDYRSPTTELLEGKASFLYQHADDPGTPGVELSEGSLAFDVRRQVDGERIGFTLGSRGEVRLRDVGWGGVRMEGTGAVRQYLVAAIPLFTYGGLDAAWDTTYARPWVEAQAGLGYGRFHDATPLVRALQLDDKLMSVGVLRSALPAETLLRLAATIGEGVQKPFPERVADVVAFLEAYLGRRLEIETVLLVEKVLAETRRERYCGWTVQGGFAYRLLDPKGDRKDLLLSLALDAAAAPDTDTQLLLRTRISGPDWMANQYTLSLELGLERRVAPWTRFSAGYSVFLDKPRDQRPAGTQKAVFQLELGGGWVGLNLKMEFSKAAEAPTWKQSIVISSTAYLW